MGLDGLWGVGFGVDFGEGLACDGLQGWLMWWVAGWLAVVVFIFGIGFRKFDILAINFYFPGTGFRKSDRRQALDTEI
uniref:Uncharacterized protein n=1 Tax=Fagus sylvatica TaxID=28930 RepID=A0A2N9GTQ9_FAGSY